MAPLDEPSLGELIRTLTRKIDDLSQQLNRFVTQEQRQADKDLEAERRAVLLQRISAMEARAQRLSHWVWTAVAGPVIVGAVLWLLIGGGSK